MRVLQQELERAHVVLADELPSDVVTMHSEVRLLDSETSEETRCPPQPLVHLFGNSASISASTMRTMRCRPSRVAETSLHIQSWRREASRLRSSRSFPSDASPQEAAKDSLATKAGVRTVTSFFSSSPCQPFIPPDSGLILLLILGYHLVALTSAVRTLGLELRALRKVRITVTFTKPARCSSSRKVTPSFAPAIHLNQFVRQARSSGGSGSIRISSPMKPLP